MKIRLLSDLHTEFKRDYRTEAYSQYLGEDVLVLAGDIASGGTNTLDVLKHFKRLGFPHIVYVPGNHEYYNTSVQHFDAKLATACQKLEGVHFLNPGTVNIGDVMFVGATLWTNFGEDALAEYSAARRIADFRIIKGFSPEVPGFSTADSRELFYKHRDYIKLAYERRNPGKKVVIVTHFLPDMACVHPRWRDQGDVTFLLNKYFANSLGNWISELDNTTWMFGHTHDSVDTTIGSTRLVANPHGYPAPDECHEFDPLLQIEV